MTLILAVIPVLLLIILMAFFKMSGDKSSIISLIVTMLIALFGFAFSVDNLFYSFLYGALKAVSPILIIILMAIFSYNVLLKTEKMEIIKQQFASISTDKSIQVLLLTWGFGGLLEAMAGFGTAVAIPAAILISLGFKPIFSATVSLIANSVATAFGAIGTPVLVLAKETNLDVLHLSTNVVLQLSVLMFLIPLVLLFLTDSKLKSLPKNIFLALLVGGVSLASQYVAAKYMGAESPAIIGSILSIIVIVIYGKLTASKEEKARKSHLKTKDILNAWSIYLLILFLIILTSPLFPGLRHTLENNWITRISLPINASTVNYTISWLTHAGVLLFIGSFIVYSLLCISQSPEYHSWHTRHQRKRITQKAVYRRSYTDCHIQRRGSQYQDSFPALPVDQISKEQNHDPCVGSRIADLRKTWDLTPQIGIAFQLIPCLCGKDLMII